MTSPPILKNRQQEDSIRSQTVSVVIPTLNEEKYIHTTLLSLLSDHSAWIKEIIVADCCSNDGTRSICMSLGTTVVDGGRPSVARNLGAAAASGEFVLFLDADTILPKDFFPMSLASLKLHSATAITFFIQPLEQSPILSVLFWIFNVLSVILQRTPPLSLVAGCCILTTSASHHFIGGFNPQLIVLEEYDYIRRQRVAGKHVVLPRVVFTSMRRFHPFKNALKQIFSLIVYYLHWVLRGGLKEDYLCYWYATSAKQQRTY